MSELLPLAFSDGTFAAGGPFGPRAIEDGNWLSLGKRNGGSEGDHARRDSGAARCNPRLALACGGRRSGKSGVLCGRDDKGRDDKGRCVIFTANVAIYPVDARVVKDLLQLLLGKHDLMMNLGQLMDEARCDLPERRAKTLCAPSLGYQQKYQRAG